MLKKEWQSELRTKRIQSMYHNATGTIATIQYKNKNEMNGAIAFKKSVVPGVCRHGWNLILDPSRSVCKYVHTKCKCKYVCVSMVTTCLCMCNVRW